MTFVYGDTSRSQELRRWFISQELDLFRLRFQNETASAIQDFLKESQMEFEPVSASLFCLVLSASLHVL